MENTNQHKSASEAVSQMLNLIRNKVITPIYNEDGKTVGFNYNANSTGMQYAKMIHGHMTVGKTEEERLEDEKALIKFLQEWERTDIYLIIKVAQTLDSDAVTAEKLKWARDVMDRMDGIGEYAPAPKHDDACKSKYSNLALELNVLSDDELRMVMNKARREHARDLFNASRKLMRHRGYSC